MVLFIVPVVSTGAFFCILSIMDYFPGLQPSVFVSCLILLCILLLINFCVFYLFRRYARLLSEALESELLHQQMKMQKEYYRKVEERQQSVNGIRHDMRNVMDTLALLIDRQQVTEVSRLLEDMCGKLDNTRPFLSTVWQSL